MREERVASPKTPQRASPSRAVLLRQLAELRAQNEALQASEQRYRLLFDAMDDGFCILQVLFDDQERPVDYRFLETNPAFERHTGLVDAIGRTARELLPDLEDHWIEIYGRVALTGEPFHSENGSDVMGRWFDVFAFRVEEPEARKVALLFKDITERRQSEIALREAKQVAEQALAAEQAARAEAEARKDRITNILESISDAFVALDSRGYITYMNQRAEQLLGRSRTQILGKCAWEEFPELIGSAFHRQYRQALSTGVGVHFEERYEPLSAWVEVHAFPTPDGLTVYFRNITRRKRAEELQRFLARVSETLAASIEYEPTLQNIVRLAVPQLGDSCVLYILEASGEFSRAAALHADPEKDTLLQQLLRQTPPKLDSPTSPVSRVLRTGRAELIPEIGDDVLQALATSDDHLQILRQVTPHTLVVTPLISRGRTFGALSIGSSDPQREYDRSDLALVEDVAGRVALAIDNARLYRDAQRAARARQEILHVVSHDLKNSLHATSLHAELLMHSAPEVGPRAPGRSHIEAIRRSTEHMHRLVQDLLDVESIEAGRLSLEPWPLAPVRLVGEALEMLTPLAEMNTLRLETKVPARLPLVLADHGRILQVLVNIVGNAIKFTPEGGRIALRAGHRDGEVRFSVQDSGPGIASADLDRVFDRYWQAESAATKGVGLGLTIARGIVAAHGGRIWAESEPGKGSTFHFTVPVVRQGEKTS